VGAFFEAFLSSKNFSVAKQNGKGADFKILFCCVFFFSRDSRC
jgi:hypothetical protein